MVVASRCLAVSFLLLSACEPSESGEDSPEGGSTGSGAGGGGGTQPVENGGGAGGSHEAPPIGGSQSSLGGAPNGGGPVGAGASGGSSDFPLSGGGGAGGSGGLFNEGGAPSLGGVGGGWMNPACDAESLVPWNPEWYSTYHHCSDKPDPGCLYKCQFGTSDDQWVFPLNIQLLGINENCERIYSLTEHCMAKQENCHVWDESGSNLGGECWGNNGQKHAQGKLVVVQPDGASAILQELGNVMVGGALLPDGSIFALGCTVALQTGLSWPALHIYMDGVIDSDMAHPSYETPFSSPLASLNCNKTTFEILGSTVYIYPGEYVLPKKVIRCNLETKKCVYDE